MELLHSFKTVTAYHASNKASIQEPADNMLYMCNQ